MSGELIVDRDLVPGVVVRTDLGEWQVIETPGHAPSHVCLHQPERRLLISGDHLLGRVSPYFDQGHTPDPVGEFLDSLGKVDALDARLCLAGHGRPFTDVHGHVEANRAMVAERLEATRAASGRGLRHRVRAHPPPRRRASSTRRAATWALSMTLAWLTHLERLGEARAVGRRARDVVGGLNFGASRGTGAWGSSRRDVQPYVASNPRDAPSLPYPAGVKG